MASYSSSYHLFTSSESENDNENNIEFNTIKKKKINKSQPFKNILASNLPHQNVNNSLEYFKKLKTKTSLNNSEAHKHFTTTHSLPQTLKTNYDLPVFKNISIYGKEQHKKNFSNSIDLNIEFPDNYECPSSSDHSDLIYLKSISKNKEINTSSSSIESNQSKFYLNRQNIKSPINNSLKNNENNIKYFDSSSTSTNSFSFSHINFDHNGMKEKKNSELDLDELSSDYSLSDEVFRKDDSDRKSQLSLIHNKNNSFSQLKSISPKSLLLNTSLGIDDELLNDDKLQELLNFTTSIPDLICDNLRDEQDQIENGIDKQHEHNIVNNEHNKINESNPISDKIDTNEQEPKSSPIKSVEGKCLSSELHCSHCKCSYKSKNAAKKTSHKNLEKKNERKKKQSKLKDLLNAIPTKTSDILRIKENISYNKKTHISNQHTKNQTEDIGLEYDTSKDNYMVELSNGALVPAFLSTLNPKYEKKVCACGITTSEIPLYWTESFHDILHNNIHKLFFKSIISDNDFINFKENNLSYRILILHMNNYNDKYIQKSVNNIDDFVSLEYGISKIGIRSYKDTTIYLALLPNFKAIGYLEVEPIQTAYKYNQHEPVSEITMSAKFGVSKLWVLIKYRNKKVDINLLEVLREKENLQKEDLAFSLNGCLGVQFIQEYIGNTNILIYKLTSTH